jgi:hypothetical protein
MQSLLKRSFLLHHIVLGASLSLVIIKCALRGIFSKVSLNQCMEHERLFAGNISRLQ